MDHRLDLLNFFSSNVRALLLIGGGLNIAKIFGLKDPCQHKSFHVIRDSLANHIGLMEEGEVVGTSDGECACTGCSYPQCKQNILL